MENLTFSQSMDKNQNENCLEERNLPKMEITRDNQSLKKQ